MQHAIYEAIYQFQWQALKYLTKLAGLGNLVTWSLSLTNSCNKSLTNNCNKSLTNSCNKSLTNSCNKSLIDSCNKVWQIVTIKVWQIIGSFHSILFATFSSPGVEMINAFANRVLAGLINFCLKRMKCNLCLSPKYLISKCWFWIPIARHGPAKVWISLHKIFLVPPKYISGNFTKKIGFDADCGGYSDWKRLRLM